MSSLNDIIPKGLTKKKVSDAGLALLLILLILHYYFDISLLRDVAILSLIAVMVVPNILKPWAFIWYAISGVLGYVISNFMLGVIYFLFVLPMGFIRKFLGKDSLQLRSFKNDLDSAFVTRNHVFVKDDLEKMF